MVLNILKSYSSINNFGASAWKVQMSQLSPLIPTAHSRNL